MKSGDRVVLKCGGKGGDLGHTNYPFSKTIAYEMDFDACIFHAYYCLIAA